MRKTAKTSRNAANRRQLAAGGSEEILQALRRGIDSNEILKVHAKINGPTKQSASSPNKSAGKPKELGIEISAESAKPSSPLKTEEKESSGYNMAVPEPKKADKKSTFKSKQPEKPSYPLSNAKLPSELPCPCPNHYHYARNLNFPPVSPAIADSNRHFIPSGPNKPADIFHATLNRARNPAIRFIAKNNKAQMLIFVNGVCGHTPGESAAQAGYGIVLTCSDWAAPFSLPLEQDGQPHTDCRAEVRAALAAIGLKDWAIEGFSNVVIGTASKYLYDGIERLSGYVKNGGKIRAKKGGKTVIKNKDVWFALEKKLRELERKGVLVQFWLMPREVNEAEAVAREAVGMNGDDCSAITDIDWVEREKMRMETLVNYH